MTPVETQAAMILNTAATAPFGIAVRVSNVYVARAVLYRVRKLLGDSALAQLQIRVSPDDAEGELWLVRKPRGPELALVGLTSSNETDIL